MQWSLKSLSERRIGPRDAVMFDIDDTLINQNRVPMRKNIQLLMYCKALGYKIVIMTARPPSDFTKRQLNDLGIPYDFLLFVPARDKTRVKKQLNLHFILSVGDQVTDLGGSTYWIKLPDSKDSRGFTNISIDYRNSYT